MRLKICFSVIILPKIKNPMEKLSVNEIAVDVYLIVYKHNIFNVRLWTSRIRIE